jgi:hypothetical protein
MPSQLKISTFISSYKIAPDFKQCGFAALKKEIPIQSSFIIQPGSIDKANAQSNRAAKPNSQSPLPLLSHLSTMEPN